MNINIPGVKPESTIESLYKTIGFIVVQWGHCEQSLESLVKTLYQDYAGDNLQKHKSRPLMLNEKLKFIKKCIRDLPLLEQFKIEIQALIEDFEYLSKIRNDLMHGAIADFNHDNYAYSFINLERPLNNNDYEYFNYDLKAFPDLAIRLQHLAKHTPNLARRVFDARPLRP